MLRRSQLLRQDRLIIGCWWQLFNADFGRRNAPIVNRTWPALFFAVRHFMKFFVRIQTDKNHAMFIHASLQIDLVLSKLIMALAFS